MKIFAAKILCPLVIVDQNYPTLARLVFEINSYSEQMAGLHTCAHKTVRMVHQALESIKDVHELLTLQVPPDDIEELSISVSGLLASIQGHCADVDLSFERFKKDEVCTALV